MTEEYKFQGIQVYRLALDYIDAIYSLCEQLPEREKFNLRSQLQRAVTSIALNIAEGSTGQTDAQQRRFLGLSLRSCVETIACLDIIESQKYISPNVTSAIRRLGHTLIIELQAFKRAFVVSFIPLSSVPHHPSY